MALRNHELDVLKDYLPDNTLEDVLEYMHTYKIHLILQKDRKSLLGYYKPPHKGKPHTISLNISLNKYHLLITFIHEVAHLINYLQHRQKVAPHGKEWKAVFALLLQRFNAKKVFPPDIEAALNRSVQNLSASTCSDPLLYRTLQRYDLHKTHLHLVEQLLPGAVFCTTDQRRFRVLAKRRTRYECEEISTGKKYLFPGLYEVIAE